MPFVKGTTTSWTIGVPCADPVHTLGDAGASRDERMARVYCNEPKVWKLGKDGEKSYIHASSAAIRGGGVLAESTRKVPGAWVDSKPKVELGEAKDESKRVMELKLRSLDSAARSSPSKTDGSVRLEMPKKVSFNLEPVASTPVLKPVDSVKKMPEPSPMRLPKLAYDLTAATKSLTLEEKKVDSLVSDPDPKRSSTKTNPKTLDFNLVKRAKEQTEAHRAKRTEKASATKAARHERYLVATNAPKKAEHAAKTIPQKEANPTHAPIERIQGPTKTPGAKTRKPKAEDNEWEKVDLGEEEKGEEEWQMVN